MDSMVITAAWQDLPDPGLMPPQDQEVDAGGAIESSKSAERACQLPQPALCLSKCWPRYMVNIG